MSTPDFFRARLDQMIDLRHPLAVLAGRLPWATLEATFAPLFARTDRPGRHVIGDDLLGTQVQVVGGGVAAAGRPRLPMRLLLSLLYLKHAFDLSDEELVARWSENVVWQFFSGQAYYTPTLPCDATQIGRFRKTIGEAGVEELLKATIDTAVAVKAIKPVEFERVIVDSTVQEKAIAHPTDSRLLEVARHQVVKAAKAAGLVLKQTFVREGRTLRRKAGGYAHARQMKRLRRVVKRQRTILGIVLREVERRRAEAGDSAAACKLDLLRGRAERIATQQRTDKNKLYAVHAPEVECIGKGKARKPYEFGVKVGIVVTHKQGLVVGARSFPGNPYDGHLLAGQLEQVNTLLEDHGTQPREVIADLGFRGVDALNPDVKIVHRGWIKSMTAKQRRWLKRRQAIEPVIGHCKADHRMERCWLKGELGDALHAVLCATGYNLRWLMRAVLRLGLGPVLLCLALLRVGSGLERTWTATVRTPRWPHITAGLTT